MRTFNRANFTTNGHPILVFDYRSQGAIEDIILVQTDQMSMKCCLKEFGGSGVDAVHKEMKQVHGREVTIPVHPSDLTRRISAASLKYIMFLNMKHNGTIKGQRCT